eukprot:1161859-Pelagomonas_calceolata.AAC.22
MEDTNAGCHNRGRRWHLELAGCNWLGLWVQPLIICWTGCACTRAVLPSRCACGAAMHSVLLISLCVVTMVEGMVVRLVASAISLKVAGACLASMKDEQTHLVPQMVTKTCWGKPSNFSHATLNWLGQSLQVPQRDSLRKAEY